MWFFITLKADLLSSKRNHQWLLNISTHFYVILYIHIQNWRLITWDTFNKLENIQEVHQSAFILKSLHQQTLKQNFEGFQGGFKVFWGMFWKLLGRLKTFPEVRSLTWFQGSLRRSELSFGRSQEILEGVGVVPEVVLVVLDVHRFATQLQESLRWHKLSLGRFYGLWGSMGRF